MGQMQRIHPLDRLVGDDSLFLLEAMIPFVDNNAKKILVIIVKMREINLIMNSLNNPSLLSECGFDCHPQSTDDFISDLCRFMPDEVRNNINQMQQMMGMMKLFNAMDSNSTCNSAEPDCCDCKEQEPKSGLFDSVMSIINNQ